MAVQEPAHTVHGEKHRSRLKGGRTIGLWLGLAVFVFLLFRANRPGCAHPTEMRMAAVAALMAVWWITDAIPLAATALMPIVLYPLLGIMTGKQTAPVYFNHIIVLFLGGFMIALAMERWNLHKRIALWIVRLIGGSPSRLVLSFMLASALLSMWISNTATAIMMLAIGIAVIKELEEQFGKEATRKLSTSLLLGIAYGCSVGGLATLVGTPPNLSFARIFEITFPDAPEEARIDFGKWLLVGVPVMLVMLSVTWLLLTKVFFRVASGLQLSSKSLNEEYRKLGRISFPECVVLCVFVSTALLWVFRKDLVVGGFTLPGWSRNLPFAAAIDDGTIAIAMALLLFLIPSGVKVEGEGDQGQGRLLGIDVFRKLPWHIVLLFGGGFALAKGFQSSGLSALVGNQFAGLEGSPPVAMVATVCATLTFLTELTSNTATTELLLPLLASVASATDVHPLLLMIPATLSASCAFMMPVATPPNAIVFGSGRLRIGDMVKVGIVLNLVGIAVITLLFLTLGRAVFDIPTEGVPDWAAGSKSPAAHN